MAVTGNNVFSGKPFHISAVLRTTDAGKPKAIGSFEEDKGAVDVAVSGNWAFLATEFGSRVVDVATPSSAMEVDYLSTTGNANRAASSDNLGYLADGAQGLRIVDSLGACD